MLRRPLPPEPIATVATASSRAAAFAAVLAVIAVLLGRSGAVDPRAALAVLGSALLFALGAILLAVSAAVAIWRTGRRGIGRAIGGVLLAAAVLAYPTSIAVKILDQPAVDDLSTDPASPPPFSSMPAARVARNGVDHPDPPAEARETARRLYPNLQPVMLDRPGDAAYDLVLKAVLARGWRIVEAVPPRGKFGTGHIDAVAATRLMGLPIDIAIRIRPQADETRIDIRSVSRFGRIDAGANATRIQSLADDLNDADS